MQIDIEMLEEDLGIELDAKEKFKEMMRRKAEIKLRLSKKDFLYLLILHIRLKKFIKLSNESYLGNLQRLLDESTIIDIIFRFSFLFSNLSDIERKKFIDFIFYNSLKRKI